MIQGTAAEHENLLIRVQQNLSQNAEPGIPNRFLERLYSQRRSPGNQPPIWNWSEPNGDVFSW